MAKTVHIVRHAQGYHQLPLGHPDTSHLDPELTPYGLKQAAHFSQNFQLHGKIDLLCTSPMKRTIRTALVAFKQDVDNGHRIVLLPDAQEATDVPSDTGSKIEELQRVFGDVIDTTHLHTDWYLKRGVNATDTVTLRARAARLRTWLRKQLANEIVLVTHGFFAHFLTGNIDEAGEQTGMHVQQS